MTNIPHEIDGPVKLSTAFKDMVDRGKVNDVKALPDKDFKYDIRCRLRIARYNRAEACARCEEIHGTTFGGHFASAAFWVFWSHQA